MNGDLSSVYEALKGFLYIIIFVVVLIYIIQGLVLNGLNKKIYGEGTWQAWVPIANIYLLGKLTINKIGGIVLLVIWFFSGGDEGIGKLLGQIYDVAIFVLFIVAIVKNSRLKNGSLDPNAERIRIDGKDAVIETPVGVVDNTQNNSAPASPGTKYCPSCGSLQEQGAKFCTNCGQKFN